MTAAQCWQIWHATGSAGLTRQAHLQHDIWVARHAPQAPFADPVQAVKVHMPNIHHGSARYHIQRCIRSLRWHSCSICLVLGRPLCAPPNAWSHSMHWHDQAGSQWHDLHKTGWFVLLLCSHGCERMQNAPQADVQSRQELRARRTVSNNSRA